VGQNRFECLTCPYHFVINKRYYERKYLKKKEVEDIMGGKGAWDNVDKTEGAFGLRLFRLGFWIRAGLGTEELCECKADQHSAMPQRKVPQRPGLLVPAADPQCRRAHDGVLQVYKVRKGVARVAHGRSEYSTGAASDSQAQRRELLEERHAYTEFEEQNHCIYLEIPRLSYFTISSFTSTPIHHVLFPFGRT
jgi:hypothetical protein